MINIHFSLLSFEVFKEILNKASSLNFIDGLIFWTKFLVDDFGIPALIGGFIWAVPSSFITYYFVFQYMTIHRSKLARKDGLTLEEWEKIHIHRVKEIFRKIKKN